MEIKSVGIGGNNLVFDVKTIQRQLNWCLIAIQKIPVLLKVDGICGPSTIKAIRAVQAAISATPTGLVEPGSRVSELLGTTYNKDGFISHLLLPDPVTQVLLLSEGDFLDAAQRLGCLTAHIKAVVAVESTGSGFFKSKRPKILFEAHKFSEFTQHRYDLTYPSISSQHWNKKLYYGNDGEYDRLYTALCLDSNAALKATSWGLFQIMGFNFASCSFNSVEEMVKSMYVSEGDQLNAFVAYIKSVGLDNVLRTNQWAIFAARYNGPAYRENNYDVRLQEAYALHKTTV